MEKDQKDTPILEDLFVIPREVPITILRNLIELIYDVKVSGQKLIPTTGGAIIISNHTDNLDPPIQATFIERKIIYLGKHELFHPQENIMKYINHKNSPFNSMPLSFAKPLIEASLASLGGIYKANLLKWGSVPIIRNAGNGSEMNKRGVMDYYAKLEDYMVNLMKSGEILSIYPEGHRSETGEMLPFKALAAKLAIRANVPIIPSAISGATNMSKPLAFFSGDAFKAKIRYNIGKPIFPSEFPSGPEKKAAKELTEMLETRVKALLLAPEAE